MTRYGPPEDESPISSPLAELLAENLTKLMGSHPDLDSNPKLGKKTGLGASAISRLRNGHNATLETLAALAGVFHMEPWQLLVRGMDPGNPPVLLPVTEAERRLYERFKQLFAEQP